ncbi:unnamed protein product [Cochlearia groenlandica]
MHEILLISDLCGGRRFKKMFIMGYRWMNFPLKLRREDGERMTKVEKVKKRREERVVQKAQHEEEMLWRPIAFI